MGRKHCGKKEKLLVTSNFSFSHSVFKRLALQTRKNQGLFGKGFRIMAQNFVKFAVFRKLMEVQIGVFMYTGCITAFPMKTESSFEIRAYIKGPVNLNTSASQIYNELCPIHGPSVLCKRSVFRWHKRFKMVKLT